MARTGYFLVFSLFATVVAVEQSASFYGESYISVPLKDASTTTDLHLDFKTHRPHGLLLLAAGANDNLLLEVTAGRVEVKVNLGSGEATLFSSPSVRLDDQQWHEVKVTRSGATLELSVDGVVQGSVETPGGFQELNVEDGVLLGGMGTSSIPEGVSRVKSFRGCMRGVVYNSHDILAAARALMNVEHAFEISWKCDEEFSAGAGVPASFLSDSSFLAFSRFTVRDEGSVACDLKTRSQDAVLLFSAGHGQYQGDFVALELVGGRPKLSLDSGGGVVEVVIEGVEVGDGRWHQLDLTLSPHQVELQVDGSVNATRLGGQRSHLNLAGHLFLGGLGLKARPHALRLGLESLKKDPMRGSMVGCVRNLVVNARPYGFREVQVSRGVDPGCSFPFPCSREPCVDGAQCLEERDSFSCVCDKPVCQKEDSGMTKGQSESDILEMVAIETLHVREGGEVLITSNTIDVIFDYRSFRIREVAVRFRVITPPRFGHLEVDRGQRQSEAFTLFDLMTSKVKYIHEGSDSETDDATIEMSVSHNGGDLPQRMRGNFEFVLPIKVTPHNDPPKLSLPSGNQINVLSDSKIKVTRAVVDVKDPDTPAKDLLFHVHFLRGGVQSFFEKHDNPGTPVTQFSQQEVLDGKVWLAHRHDSVIDVRLNVSDEAGLKDSVLLRLRAVALRISVETNTGLVVPYTTANLLLTANLSAATNVPLQDLELRYRLTKLPRFGQIQRLQQGSGQWTDVDTFTQRHLNTSRIRYCHFSKDFSIAQDSFSFIVSAQDVETPEQVLAVTFSAVSLSVTTNNRLMVVQVPYAALRNDSLLVTPLQGHIDTHKLTLTLFRAPKLGALYVTPTDGNRIFNPLDFDALKPLEAGGNFSQADVDQGRVFFKFESAGFGRLEDYLDLTAQYPSSAGKMLRVWVEYSPLDTAIRFTNNGLRGVPEGGQKVIERRQLYLEMDDFKEFQFSLIQPPRHGNLSLIHPRTSAVLQPWLEEFTSADIRERRVVYRHDDSETDRDSFVFAATPLFQSERDMPDEIQEFTGTFHISMEMRNDNPPERAVDRVFHVVTDGSRKMTLADLAFTDPDVHFNASHLQYRRQTIANGEILNAQTLTPVYQFYQSDLEQETLLFQHKGAKLGHAAITVSDGQFYWTGLLEVQASDPYITANSSGVEVVRGGRAVISGSNLSLDTNLDLPPTSYSFVLTQPPQHGVLKVDGEEAEEFTLAEVVEGRLQYWHRPDADHSAEDLFKFTVLTGDTRADGTFFVAVRDDSMLHPPEVIHNQMLKVEEGQTAVITRSHLLLQHPSLNAEEVVFIVMETPAHGFLRLGGVALSGAEGPPEFSQGDVDRGALQYVQTQGAVTDDQFIFDVDSDTRALKNLVFSIEVAPAWVPVRGGVVTVEEGGSVALTSDTLTSLGSHLQPQDLVFTLVSPPLHGRLVDSDLPLASTLTFTSQRLAAGKVVYQHDDSESLHDRLSVMAARQDGSLKSRLVAVNITVTPINDQPPRVVINKGLSVWADSVTLLTGDHLHAEDPDLDTTSSDIIFTLTPPTNGHLAFLNNTFLQISHFSQQDIDVGSVVFVHKGDRLGEFSFQASDGVNADIQRTFRVRAHPVVLQLVKGGPLAVFPNTVHPLSNTSLLAATTSANFSKPIVFTLVNPKPVKGKVVRMAGGQPLEIQSFTQAEVNAGGVFYQHTAYAGAWLQTDSLHLEVSTAYATPLEATLSVRVSYGNINAENQAMLLGLYRASVPEGGAVTLTRAHFDTTELRKRLTAFQSDITMTFEVVTLPSHGDLFLDNARVTPATPFTQEDIDLERLRYQHDDSDTTEDVFSFSVEIGRGAESGEAGVTSPRHVLNYSIEVVPVNDQEFTLVTIKPSLKVLQGGQVVLTQAHLLTTDPDTPPDHLTYTVLDGPTNGRLLLQSDPPSPVTVETFSQEDVDQGRLLFVHNGSASSGAMYFKVTDGKFPVLFKMLDIFTIPVRIDFSRVRPVQLVQSESSAYVSGKFLNVSTNGDASALSYSLREGPGVGRLLLRGREAVTFSQADVDSRSLLYVMTNLSHSADAFRVDIFMEGLDVQLDDKKVEVVVRPLIDQSPLIVPAGATVGITRLHLDASELAARTGDDPVFRISEPPKHGSILRKLRKRRDLNAQPLLKPVETFTFEDVVYAKVFYVSNATEGSSSDEPFVADTFSYVLTASNVQPAHGKFLVNMDEEEEKGGESALGAGGDGDGIDAEMSGSTDDGRDDSSDVGTIVGAVVGVLLMVVLVVLLVLVLLRWRRRKREEDEREGRGGGGGGGGKPRPYISGPLQLEQPHVTIEPQHTYSLPSPIGSDCHDDQRCLVSRDSNLSATAAQPLLYQRSPDPTRGSEVSPAVPDCKVTPLLEGERSPGVEGGERQSGASNDLYDWTLMDPELLQHCRTETPVLRENQYWV